MTDERGRVGRPPKVNREQVVAAAADILSTDGPLKFSMRTLASRLDISAMAIYHYFESKNDLLGAVLEYQSWHTPFPELPDDPRLRLVEVTLASVEHLSRHPWVVDVLAGDEILDAYSAWAMNEFLTAADELGVSAERSMPMLNSLWRVIIGEVVVRHNRAMRAQRSNPAGWFERELPGYVTERPRLTAAVESFTDSVEVYDLRATIEAYLDGWLAGR